MEKLCSKMSKIEMQRFLDDCVTNYGFGDNLSVDEIKQNTDGSWLVPCFEWTNKEGIFDVNNSRSYVVFRDNKIENIHKIKVNRGDKQFSTLNEILDVWKNELKYQSSEYLSNEKSASNKTLKNEIKTEFNISDELREIVETIIFLKKKQKELRKNAKTSKNNMQKGRKNKETTQENKQKEEDHSLKF